MTNLTRDASRLLQYYSGGMIRRLEIAQSMLHRPKILVMDEPTVGLDPLARPALFCTLSLIVACLVKTRERFMGIGQAVTMPF